MAPSRTSCERRSVRLFEAIGGRDGNDVVVTKDPGNEALSEYETTLLDEIYEQYSHMNQWQLRDLTHTLPEWRDQQGASYPIDPSTILKEAGIDPAEIQQIAEEAEQHYAAVALSRRLARPAPNAPQCD